MLRLLPSDSAVPVVASRAAMSLSDRLHAASLTAMCAKHQVGGSDDDDNEEAPIPVEAAHATLKDLVKVAECVVARVAPGGVSPQACAALDVLRSLPLSQQMCVLRAATQLGFRPIQSLAAEAVARVLRGRSADVLRVVLDAANDLTREERAAALAEPLFTPPDDDDGGGSSGGKEEEEEASEEVGEAEHVDGDMYEMCLSSLDARSLRQLKGVSKAWRRRARRVLSDAASAWRQAPEWSAGEWARDWFAPRLRSADESMRLRGLLALDALEAAVELPEFVPLLLPVLEPDARASHRGLALRALARVEAATLAPHADELRRRLDAALEPFEEGLTATRRLRAKLRGGGDAAGGEVLDAGDAANDGASTPPLQEVATATNDPSCMTMMKNEAPGAEGRSGARGGRRGRKRARAAAAAQPSTIAGVSDAVVDLRWVLDDARRQRSRR